MRQIVVCRLAFLRQKADVLGAFGAEYVVGGHPLTLQDVILDVSRCPQRGSRLMAGRRLVRLQPCSSQQRVGKCSCVADDRVRRFIGARDFIIQRTIGSIAFETKALVGLFALRTRGIDRRGPREMLGLRTATAQGKMTG